MPEKLKPWGHPDSYKGFDPKSKQDQETYGGAYQSTGLLDRMKKFLSGDQATAATTEALRRKQERMKESK